MGGAIGRNVLHGYGACLASSATGSEHHAFVHAAVWRASPSYALLWRRQRIEYSRGLWWSLFVRRAACRAPISVCVVARQKTSNAVELILVDWSGHGRCAACAAPGYALLWRRCEGIDYSQEPWCSPLLG